MFEDSTFESAGRIRTRSRGWMIAASIFNGSILLALILIPLIYPEALPRHELPWLIPVPPPAAPERRPARQQVQPARGMSEVPSGHIQVPLLLLHSPLIPNSPDPQVPTNIADLGQGHGGSDGPDGIFPGQSAAPVVRLVPNRPVRVSGSVVEGLLIHKTIPIYPRIGVAVRAEGTVVLQATISKAGTIENLRVVSGPPILEQAAIDAVKT